MKGGRRLERALFLVSAAGAAALALWHFLGGRVYSVQNFSLYADRGELLIHAVLDKAVSYSMPLLSLLVAAAEYHSSITPETLARAARMLILLPAYAIGARGGRARGALFALAAMTAALGVVSHEAEQIIYTFAILVFLSADSHRIVTGGAAWSALSGVAAAGTLLIRSPLFGFPPLSAAFGWFTSAEKPGRKLLAAGLFLACAYLPLAPWARLNHAVFGRPILLEQERATCNLITGAAGVTFTIEGDARAFAGISRTDDPYRWAFRRIMDYPGAYALSVVRRLWQVFLFFPALILLAAAGFWLNRRDPAARLTALLAGYYILLHCLLSIEERYFYPVRFLLALLAAGGLWAVLERYGRFARREKTRDLLTPALVGLIAAGSAVALGFVWRYPGAARPGIIGLSSALERAPDNPWLHEKMARTLFSYDMTARGRAELSAACGLGGRPDLCWLHRTLTGGPPGPPPAVENRYELILVRSLKELELGMRDAALRSFAEAREMWADERNGIKEIPYKSDLEHLERIFETNRTFWDDDIHSVLLYWPPGARPGLLRAISEFTPLTPKLRHMLLSHRSRLTAPERKELAGLTERLGAELQGSESDWPGTTAALTAELLRRPVPVPAGIGAELRTLAELFSDPEEGMDPMFSPGPDPQGKAMRAAAETFLSEGKARSEAARRLADADPGNFAYSLISLREAGFSPETVKEAMARLRARPGALAAGAAAWALRGKARETLLLAEAAMKAGGLEESDWALLLPALQDTGGMAAGLKAADAALREHPGSSRILNDRGTLRYLSGDTAGALSDFSAALSSDPSNFAARMNLGSAFARSGDRERAAEIYRLARDKAGDENRRSAAAAALAGLSPR